MVTTMADSGVSPIIGRSLGELKEMVRGRGTMNLWLFKLCHSQLPHSAFAICVACIITLQMF